jgi:hypothetical protein
MAGIYVRSTDGSNADNGSTWALAKLDGAGAAAIDAAGDTIYLSQSHAESTAAAITWAWAGTAGNPTKVICANDGAEPPTAAATTATVSTTGASNITITGHAYHYGITFNAGSSTNAASILAHNASNESQVYEKCKFVLNNSSTTSRIRMGQVNDGGCQEIKWKGCDAKFGQSQQRIDLRAKFSWDGGTFLSGTTSPASVFVLGSRSVTTVIISGVDFSNLGSSVSIIDESTRQPVKFGLRNCKLPASWSGSLWSASPSCVGMRAEMHNCDSADTNYRLWVEDYSGSIKHETTIVKSGGASDGTTAYSWKMASSANASYPFAPLESPEIIGRWNTTVGSSITVTIDILHDSLTNLTDSEVWIEAQYLGSSGFPLGTFLSDAKADPLVAAADQTASTATWTTTGLTNPNKQKLSVTFTPQEAGYLQAKVFLAKASKTVYVDPDLQVT